MTLPRIRSRAAREHRGSNGESQESDGRKASRYQYKRRNGQKPRENKQQNDDENAPENETSGNNHHSQS